MHSSTGGEALAALMCYEWSSIKGIILHVVNVRHKLIGARYRMNMYYHYIRHLLICFAILMIYV